MQALAAAEAPGAQIEPWDYLYYAERVRQARYAIDVATLSQYFELGRMIDAALWSAEQRYGIAFREISGAVPVFHPDVRVWEVTDMPSGAHRGLFYFDTFARGGKRSGAWASSYRAQCRMDGGVTALASNNNNFLRGAPGEPVLVSLDDVRTLFHEFGHALHSLLQDVTYPLLAATPRDFVELPSQINERWLLTPELLDRFARHAVTGAPLPQSVLETLAVIAYRQPVTVPEIGDIRGVNASGVIGTLVDRKLIKIVGRKAVVGRPFMYGTTREFLERFGLNDIGDLPKVEDRKSTRLNSSHRT